MPTAELTISRWLRFRRWQISVLIIRICFFGRCRVRARSVRKNFHGLKIDKNRLRIAGNSADIAEFAFPAGNDGAGEAIAGDVDGGASHVDEGVDAEDDEDGCGGKVKGCRGCEENEERGGRTAWNTFAGKRRRETHRELLRSS